MIELVWIDAGGEEHLLHTSSNTPAMVKGCILNVVREKGFGMPPVLDETEKGPDQDGVTWLFGHLGPRIIDLTLKLYGDYEDLHRARKEIVRWFNPGSDVDFGLGTLRRVSDVLRDIRCRFTGGLDFDIIDEDIQEINFPLSLFCPDPLFYNPYTAPYQFLVTSNNELRFPISFPITFGGDIISATEIIYNVGEWPIYPIITIEGPAVDLLIENLSTGHQLYMSGYAISVGETVTIDLRYSIKTVKNQNDVDLIGYMSTDSDIGDFVLKHHPELPGGANQIRVFAGGATIGSQVSIAGNTLFLSG